MHDYSKNELELQEKNDVICQRKKDKEAGASVRTYFMYVRMYVR